MHISSCKIKLTKTSKSYRSCIYLHTTTHNTALFALMIYPPYIMSVQYIRGCSVDWEEIMSSSGGGGDTTINVRKVIEKTLKLYGNAGVLNIPQCTHDIPHTHHGIPHTHHGIPSVLRVFPDDIPWCTEHPPVYSVIYSWCTVHPRCTAQTLRRVIDTYPVRHTLNKHTRCSEKK